MTATLERPTTAPGSAPPQPAVRSARREDLLMVATLALLVSACLPLARVFVGLDFLRPVLGSVLLALGLTWGARRMDVGPLWTLLITAAGWFAFSSVAFFAETLAAGVVPTSETLNAVGTLWVRGMELLRLRPAPAFAEAGLLFITVTGVWAITHAVEGLVFRLAAPLKAIVMALVLWAVPLAVAPASDRPWVWAVPFLAAAALLMLAFAGSDLRRWGTWTPSGRGGAEAPERTLLPSGSVLALVAIVAGAVLSGALPGFGEAPWYQVRGLGGTTLTTNPIVDIRTRLVAQDTGPVMRVTADRPVYLRTTGLDVYSSAEEWTNAGIRGAPVGDRFPQEVPLGPVERVRLEVEVHDLPRAVLVPAPYQSLTVSGPLAESFQYDSSSSTVTLDAGVTLQRGDTYALLAAVPAPTAEQLEDAPVALDDARLTHLPDNVPAAVTDLAAQIVDRADASSPVEQALAIQNTLRSWEYSVEPPQGHGGQAMLAFVENRIGYCEQFAGTMAVMLRSLGIPSRVAVGYTPGQLVDADSNAYIISNGNAHAWVEVLFDGLGWIAFEPTPRDDGNVLVPSATNVAPSITVAQAGGEPGAEGTIRDEDVVDTPDRPGEEQQLPPVESDETADGAAAGQGGGAGRAVPIALVGLLAAAVLGIVVGATRRPNMSGRPALERVLRAQADVEQLGRGLGIVPALWETDREYLGRLAHRHGSAAQSAAATLAAQSARARYAVDLAPQSADEAEQASGALSDEILREIPTWRRPLVRVRGTLSAALERLPQRSSSPRPR